MSYDQSFPVAARGASRGRSFIIAPEGWPFVAVFTLATILFLILEIWLAAVPLALLTLFTLFFFRNPRRQPPQGSDLVVSPADGKVVEVTQVKDNIYTGSPAKKVGIFMSPFNVHVNRIPVDGRVEKVRYYPGKFLVAFKDKASEDNERNAVLINMRDGLSLAVVQIAGFIARRIVCYLSHGDRVSAGERFGIIRFGSRVDLYLPENSKIAVSVGDRVKAGVTVVGRFT